jgi:hypothetical protein
MLAGVREIKSSLLASVRKVKSPFRKWATPRSDFRKKIDLYWLRNWTAKVRLIRLVLFLMLFSAFVGLCIIIFAVDWKTTFRVDAKTQAMSFFATGNHPTWPVPPRFATVPVKPPSECVAVEFRPAPGAVVQMSQGVDEALRVSVFAREGDHVAGVFKCSSGLSWPCPDDPGHADCKSVLLDRVDLEWTKTIEVPESVNAPRKEQAIQDYSGGLGVDYILRLRAAGAVIGSDLEDGVAQPLLLQSGAILAESAGFGFSSRVDSKTDLDLGDKVSFENGSGSPSHEPVELVGFIARSNGPAFRVVGRAYAERAKILPYGEEEAEAVSIAPSLIARVKASQELVLLVPLLWVLMRFGSTAYSIARRDLKEEREADVLARKMSKWIKARRERKA